MLMLMARRELTDGAFGLRLMLSGEPLMGGGRVSASLSDRGDGRRHHPLIDRQHPHDLLMEAAASYSHDLSAQSSLFVYAGLPGEPALGPPVYMSRLSAMDNPEAPLGHHWLDSTHIAWGVITGGYALGALKLEVSALNGREPNQNHYDIETRSLDSYSGRISYNPTRDWSLQLSSGHLVSPEQLTPAINVQRTTASLSYNAPLGLAWQTTFAFGRNAPSSGRATDAWLLESTLRLTAAQTFFGRLERVAKDELFLPGSPLYGESFTINKLSLGYIYDFVHWNALAFGVGGLVSAYSYPSALNAAYDYRPTSFMVFACVRL